MFRYALLFRHELYRLHNVEVVCSVQLSMDLTESHSVGLGEKLLDNSRQY